MSSSSEASTPPTRQQPVQEFVDSRGVAVASDVAAGVLRGVKLLGLTSRNARRYRESALREAIVLYEGAKVNVNHPRREPLAPRDYRDRLGVVRNVRLALGKGLFGDLHFNPKHALAEQLAWDAEHAPENVGLSHNVIARTRREGDETVVESIRRVQSVDLVADPATTKGLFEHAEDADGSIEPLQSMVATEQGEAIAEDTSALRLELNATRKRARMAELCLEHGVAPGHETFWTEAFARQIDGADPDELESLFEDRVALLGRRGSSPTPESRARPADEQPPKAAPRSTADFLSAISRAA